MFLWGCVDAWRAAQGPCVGSKTRERSAMAVWDASRVQGEEESEEGPSMEEEEEVENERCVEECDEECVEECVEECDGDDSTSPSASRRISSTHPIAMACGCTALWAPMHSNAHSLSACVSACHALCDGPLWMGSSACSMENAAAMADACSVGSLESNGPVSQCAAHTNLSRIAFVLCKLELDAPLMWESTALAPAARSVLFTTEEGVCGAMRWCRAALVAGATGKQMASRDAPIAHEMRERATRARAPLWRTANENNVCTATCGLWSVRRRIFACVDLHSMDSTVIRLHTSLHSLRTCVGRCARVHHR